MVFLGYPNDRFDHIWEAAATATALLHIMIDLSRHDQLPRIAVQQIDDRPFDFLFGDDVAVADQHVFFGLAARRFPRRHGWKEGVVYLYWKTLSGASRLSEPSKAMASSFSAATTRSIDFVWSTSASMAACTVALPSALPSPICWS
ncbi:hypothetical protein CF98_14730 [Halopseudomonas bauzanensis]|nr:hypothetical protein CF98_14730 [Halopseudomonas bauzanensis]